MPRWKGWKLIAWHLSLLNYLSSLLYYILFIYLFSYLFILLKGIGYLNNSIYLKHDLKVQQRLCGCVQLIKLELINYNKTNIRIRRIYNLCGLKEHLSDFLKASMSQIDLIWLSRAFHRIIDLYEHAFLIISVLGLGNLERSFSS